MAGLESHNNSSIEKAGQRSSKKSESASTQAKAAQKMGAGPSYPVSHADKAIAAFEQEQLPPVPDAPEVLAKLVRNALILIENKEHRLATNLLRNVLMRKPNEPRALRWLGHCLREENRLDEAAKCFKALSQSQGDNESLALYAETLYLSGKDEEAMRVYEMLLMRVTDASPELFDIYKNLGNIQVRAGDFDAAEECYHKANTVRSDSDILMVNYGTLEIQRENFSEAVTRFRRAVEINAANDKGWVGLAMVHRQMGDLELGQANIERALDINPKNKTALNVLVEWNAKDQNFAPSIRRLKDFLAMESEDAEVSFLLARILVHENQLTEAQLELERALSLEPSIPGGTDLMSVLQKEIGRRLEVA